MSRRSASLFLFLFFLSCLSIAPVWSKTGSRGELLYQQNCATCHGINHHGGNAESLVDDKWQFGASMEKHLANVKEGLVERGMPAFKDTMTDDEMKAVMDYILRVKSQGLSKTIQTSSRGTLETLDYLVRTEVWVDGLEQPWGIDFIDNRQAVVTEQPGRLRLVVDGRLDPKPIEGTPDVLFQGQGGLLDVTIDPKISENGWIYLSYSHRLSGDQENLAMTRIVRGRIKDHRWADEQVVYQAPIQSYSTTRHHYGNRIVFDQKGYLYFSIGDRGAGDFAQKLDRPNGKVHRLYPDGSVPSDNPFAGQPKALATIFSYGHRNPQGLVIHPLTDELWEVEHGPRGGDEVNLIKSGKNYGWPLITYGINYNGSVITRKRIEDGMEQPRWFWRPSTAVCSIDFYRGDEFPYWKNHLLVTALKDQDLRLLQVQDGRVIHEEILFDGLGRVRDVITGPDGAIYVVLNSPHQILRLSSLGERKY
jgi:aldose sugar dehydrogenase